MTAAQHHVFPATQRSCVVRRCTSFEGKGRRSSTALCICPLQILGHINLQIAVFNFQFSIFNSPEGRMDFGFTPDQEALRAEMRALLDSQSTQAILAEMRQLPP